MSIRNENRQYVEVSAYASELLVEGLGEGEVTEQDAQNALAELWVANRQEEDQRLLVNKGAFAVLTVQDVNKEGLWDELKKIFCDIIKGESIFGKIVDYVLEAIAKLIPLGIFIKALVKVIIKFFLQKGIDWVCPAKDN